MLIFRIRYLDSKHPGLFFKTVSKSEEETHILDEFVIETENITVVQPNITDVHPNITDVYPGTTDVHQDTKPISTDEHSVRIPQVNTVEITQVVTKEIHSTSKEDALEKHSEELQADTFKSHSLNFTKVDLVGIPQILPVNFSIIRAVSVPQIKATTVTNVTIDQIHPVDIPQIKRVTIPQIQRISIPQIQRVTIPQIRRVVIPQIRRVIITQIRRVKIDQIIPEADTKEVKVEVKPKILEEVVEPEQHVVSTIL